MLRTTLLFIAMLSLLSACDNGETPSESQDFNSTNNGLFCKPESAVGPKAIYGNDNRLDWFEAPGQTTEYWALATLALMSGSNLSDKGDHYEVEALSYEKSMGLCRGQKFSDQPSAAFCSGFLVGEDLVVTAGHCVRSQGDCESIRFVFDFNKKEQGQVGYKIPKTSVYQCDSLVKREVGSNDYAVIRLDRKVEDRVPLNIRRQGSVAVNENVMLIGHPMGLPSKIAEGGRVLRSDNKIYASVDAFAANSGSVILNMETGLVEGLLVAGEPDFIFTNGCRVEATCGEACQGEVITPISKLAEFIPEGNYQNPACQ